MGEKGLITVALSGSDNWYAKIIQRMTQSPVNHAFVMFEDPTLRGWWAIQVDTKGVRILPAEYLKHNKTCLQAYSAAGDVENAYLKVRHFIGKDYDYPGIAGFFIQIMAFRAAGKKIKNVLHRNDELFCSEFVAEFINAAWPDVRPFKDPSVVSPGDLYDFLSNLANGFTPIPWPKEY